MQALSALYAQNDSGGISSSLTVRKKLLQLMIESSLNSDGLWQTSVEHENTFIPNVTSRTEIGSEPGEEGAGSRVPFLRCFSSFPTEHVAASATVDPYKSEVTVKRLEGDGCLNSSQKTDRCFGSESGKWHFDLQCATLTCPARPVRVIRHLVKSTRKFSRWMIQHDSEKRRKHQAQP